ncbi:MAG: VWA domain-containing protein [Acidobacteriaceae bacterium]
MTRIISIECAAIFLCAGCAAVAQAPPKQDIPSLQLNANLVVVDVVVRDDKSNPVHRLNARNFSVRENGHLQTIKTFEEHTATNVAQSGQPINPSELAPGQFTNNSLTSPNRSLNLILLDKLNTPMQDQTYCVDQVANYLTSAPAGTDIAVVTLTSSGMFLLQGFTSDPRMLRGATKNTNVGMKASLLANNPVSGRSRKAVGSRLKARVRRELTLGALNQLARYLSGFPGRKNLIWLSASFPIGIDPAEDGGFAHSQVLDDEFRDTVNLLAFNRVAVYPVDARGLVSQSYFAASNPGANNMSASISALSSSDQAFFAHEAARAFAMADIAAPTGGNAFMNTNDLKGAVGKAIEEGSDYYTLTYSPSDPRENKQYRKINVQVNLPGSNLSYRRGYYEANPAKSTPRTEESINPTAPVAYSAMRAAMVYGSPEPTQISLQTNIRPVTTNTTPSVAKGNQPGPKTRGPYRLYSVHYIAHLRDIECPAISSSAVACSLEIFAFVYNSSGALVNSQANELRATIKASYYAAMHQPGLVPGFQYRQEISVPIKGDYFLRLGIHDLNSDRVGTLEVPVSAVDSLPAAP